MCDDNEECGGPDAVAKVLASIHGPGVERDCQRFLGHMRAVIPQFAQGVDEDTLLTVFCAGRTNAIDYIRNHTEHLYEASNAMTAMVLSAYSKAQGIDVEKLNANLDKFKEEHPQPQEAMQ